MSLQSSTATAYGAIVFCTAASDKMQSYCVHMTTRAYTPWCTMLQQQSARANKTQFDNAWACALGLNKRCVQPTYSLYLTHCAVQPA
eukprot:20630-Heterococcus_DN1.PRE.1